MSEQIIKVIVAGAGRRSIWAIKEILNDPLYKLVGLCEPLKEKAEHILASENISKLPHYPTFEKCLNNLEFDAVISTVADFAHCDVAVPTLNAGKYLFLEKPLEITEERCRKIVEADEKAGNKTFVGFNMRYAPFFEKVKEILDSKILGKTLTIQADE